jgi:DNA-binding NarL/FixJ family response regulator
MIRVLIADDQTLVRGAFRMMLDSEPDIQVVGEAADGRDAVEQARLRKPDVVLMDVRMPGTDGIEATRRLLLDGAGPRVLMLTTFDLDEYVYEAIRAGASGFMLKNAPPEQLAAAVRTVASGEALLAPSITRRLIEKFAARPLAGSNPPKELTELTSRELEVLRQVARGCSNAEIASTLVVSEATIKTHVNRILTKLGLRDRTQAAVLAYETGLVQPGENISPPGPSGARGSR